MAAMTLERVFKSFHNRWRIGELQLRGALARVLYAPVWTCGAGLLRGRDVRFEVYGKLTIGKNVQLEDGCLLSVGPEGELEIGDGVFLGRGTVVVARQSIRIGARCLVAEHCSIRDADHELDAAGRRLELAGEGAGPTG